MHKIYLSLGTNLGKRNENLEMAISLLEKLGVKMLKQSKVYETEPLYIENQPKFLNMAVKAECGCGVFELLKICKKIEREMGRCTKGAGYMRNGPRIIDIDILFFDDLVIESETLIIPHPKMAERKFVLEPLNEIAKDKAHPVLGKKINELLKNY